MRKNTGFLCMLLIFFAITAVVNRPLFAADYTAADLDFGELEAQSVIDINNNGQILFQARVNGSIHSFIYNDGIITDIGNLGGDESRATATDINNNGQVVGTSYTESGEQHAYIYSNGIMTDLGTFGGLSGDAGSWATAINDSGQVVGSSVTTSGEQHAFLYSNGDMTDLGTLGGDLSAAFDINNDGQIVGCSETDDGLGHAHAFLYSNGTMTNLGAVFGGDGSWAMCINDSGQIAGLYYNNSDNGTPHAVLYSNGIVTDLGDFGGGTSMVYGINNSGQIVGGAATEDLDEHAFLYSDGTMIDLNSVIDQEYGWTIINDALAINDAGWVLGYGYNAITGGRNALIIPVSSVMVTVPDVVGMIEAGAEDAIQSVGLTVGSINAVYNDSISVGVIISQNPSAGTEVEEGSSIDLTSSLGPVPDTMIVPDVVGMEQAAAQTYLSSVVLLTTGTISQAYSSTLAAGYVISQSPAAGTEVATYSAVDLTVSLGPEPSYVNVPDATNMTQAAAQSALASAGLTVGTITQEYSDTVAAGYVIGQSPAAGTSIESGSAVSLVISLGPESVTMVTVPDVVGMTKTAAKTAISAAGLTPGLTFTDYSSTVPAGSVMAQFPLAGTSVHQGDDVLMTISLGPEMTTVPDVVGMTQADAGTAIIAAELSVGTITQEYSDSVSAGYVISQSPAAGSSAAKDSAVALTVSLGPEPVTMVTVPNVVGMTKTSAKSAISDASLVTGLIFTDYSPTVPAGSVMAQYPLAGASVPEGYEVLLTVSLGPEMTTVPTVVGLAQADAGTAIVDADLIVGTISQAYSSTVAAGNVISQSPVAGSSVAKGSAVSLTVSLGPAPVTMVTVPNVVGMTKTSAKSAIKAAGLTVGLTLSANSSTVPAGRVMAQFPLAGASVAQGSAVMITVSLGQ